MKQKPPFVCKENLIFFSQHDPLYVHVSNWFEMSPSECSPDSPVDIVLIQIVK